MENKKYIKDILKIIPEKPGIYQYFNKEGNIIYVGKAKNLHRRVSSYFIKNNKSRKTEQLVKNISDIKYVIVENEQDAFLLENNLIKKYQPKYNILLKDGKSYPRICITKEEYPRVIKTRVFKRKEGEYYGPYSSSHSVDLVMQTIQTLYPIRTCNLKLTSDGIEKQKYKLCLKYHINKCCGICGGICTKEEYIKYIDDIREIIRGNARVISENLEEKMTSLAKELKFEEAEKIKNKYQIIEKFRSRTIINNSSNINCEVFGYDENDKNAYISILRIKQGNIIQALVVEYEKRIEEEKEDILSHAMLELINQLNDCAHDIIFDKTETILPFKVEDLPKERKYTVPKTGIKKSLLDLAIKNAREYKEDKTARWQTGSENRDAKAAKELGKILGIKDLKRIESFDNSNIQGKEAVAACVVFIEGKPIKNEYRKYNIKTVEGANDYESMKEIVLRRYRAFGKDIELTDEDRKEKEERSLPDLVIADGGEIQMKAIKEATQMLRLDINIAGLVKDNKHRTATLLYGFPAKTIEIRKNRELFKFLSKIQDEVHRFAITYHRNKRSKNQIKSELEDIRGIGEASRKVVLQKFGSVRRVKNS